MNRYPTGNPFQRLVDHAVEAAMQSTSPATDASRFLPLETDPSPLLVGVDPISGATTHPFELNSDVLNDPNARLQVGVDSLPPFPF